MDAIGAGDGSHDSSVVTGNREMIDVDSLQLYLGHVAIRNRVQVISSFIAATQHKSQSRLRVIAPVQKQDEPPICNFQQCMTVF